MIARPDVGSATIGRLACRLSLPRAGVDHPALEGRLRQILEHRLAPAVGEALAPLDDADGDAVWVVRAMRADAVVSASLLDLDRLSAQWGNQLAQSIMGVIRAGPGGNVVRFASPAEYLAAFAAALAAGHADTWMFEPLAGLRLLAPGAAIRTGSAGAGVSVTSVVEALVRSRRLEIVLAAINPAQADALWAACADEARPAGVLRRTLHDRVHALAARTLPDELVAGAGGMLALRLFAVAVAELGAGPDLVLAIDAVAGGRSATFAGEGRAGGRLGLVPAAGLAAGGGSRDAAGAGALDRPGGARASGPVPEDRVFAAAGAPAFLLLPALEHIGLADQGALARSATLAGVLGCDPDDAVRLAAGDPGEGESAAGELVADSFAGAVRSALTADDRIDGRWLLTEVVGHPDGRRSVAAVRDVASDVWLAGALLSPGESAPWAQLVEAVLRDTGIAPRAVLGVGETSPPRDAAQDDAALANALAGLRPLTADVAWLAPERQGDLAVAIAARAASRDLARRLIGFGRSSMGYLAERFLPLGGIVTATDERIHAELPAAPLAVILVMAGLDRVTFQVPWLTPEVLVTHRRG